MSIINKISVKNVVGDIKPIVKGLKDGEEKEIMQVIGIASQTKSGESTYGTYTAFIGNFKATNIATGEQFVSPKCFLPEMATNILIGQMSGVDSVEFAFKLGVKENNTPIGYEYVISELVEAGENNPLALLEAKIAKK